MLNISICDDESVEIDYLTNSIYKWAKMNKVILNVSSFDSAEAFLFSYEISKQVDILLLDIQMKKLDGVTLARQLRSDGGQMQIIFITGFPDYIAEGYDVSALHYLMKPVSEERLFSVLNKAFDLQKKGDSFILLDTDNGQTKLFHRDIIFAEANAHNTMIHTTNDAYKANMYINELEEALEAGFCRVHRSYLVGLRYIRQITKTEVIMDNEEKIPLSRRRYKDINKAFIEYHKGAE